MLASNYLFVDALKCMYIYLITKTILIYYKPWVMPEIQFIINLLDFSYVNCFAMQCHKEISEETFYICPISFLSETGFLLWI